MKIFSLFLALFLLTGCTTSDSKTGTATQSNPQTIETKAQTPEKLVIRAHTPTHGDAGDFFIRGEIEEGQVTDGDVLDIVEKTGRSITVKVKSVSDGGGNIPRAVKGQMVSIYFNGDASLYDGVSMDSYLVEKGGKYPEATPVNTQTQIQESLLKGKINGKDWVGKSIMNPPPYYKFGSRAMMSPDRPILKMSFTQSSDTSSVNFDLLGGLKVGIYEGASLTINYSDMSGTTVPVPGDLGTNVKVEVTSYTENGKVAKLSGKIFGTIKNKEKGDKDFQLEWNDLTVQVWGEEAK